MHITKVRIENFRGIHEMELELHPKLNVFIGINGAGKSSVLDAISYWLAPFARILSGEAYKKDGYAKHKGNDFPAFEIRNGETESKISLIPEGWNDFITLRASNILNPRGDRKITGTRFIYLQKYSWLPYLKRDKDKSDIALFRYFRVHRGFKKISIAAWTNRDFDQRDAFIDAMSRKANFKEFFEWFRNREDLENEERKNDKQLSIVRKAISLFLDTIDPPKIYRRAPLRMVVVKNEKELRVQQLSDGEKCLLATIGDLARRLAIANPTLENPLEGEGVVLIDEIDLHLHPQWQRMILPKLTETFPNCQFIVSTHSPQILSEIHSENIICLQDGQNGIEAFPPGYETFGQTADIILPDIMKTKNRNDSVDKQLDLIFEAINEGNLTKAESLKKELETKAKDIPEYAKIEMLIHRKEKLGK
ncbi:MAG: AAA family ATPase [Planctomycetaceae bacterium]|jgi:predicted ATP-binding protein involved in virulence|nr:AAA family ATPase [Planctomycetaceae bacterium]